MTLPDTTTPNTQMTDPTNAVPPAGSQPQSFTPGIGKEGEGISLGKELPLASVGQEIDLPKEAVAAGVTVHPTSITLPQNVANLGVQSVGQHIPLTSTSGNSITLPLTNEQIIEGIKAKPELSIRWLAEWCMRQIQKVHTVVKGH